MPRPFKSCEAVNVFGQIPFPGVNPIKARQTFQFALVVRNAVDEGTECLQLGCKTSRQAYPHDSTSRTAPPSLNALRLTKD